jgi:hypothetical protein
MGGDARMNPRLRAAAMLCLFLAGLSSAPLLAEVVAVASYVQSDSAGSVPVAATLPSSVNEPSISEVWETSGGPALRIPHQRDPREPKKIWFLPSNRALPGDERRFEFRTGDDPESTYALRAVKDDRVLTVFWGDRRVLQYNHAPVPPPEGVDPVFTRSGYIHPVWTPSGKLVTEDHPADHYHHKGVWFPWTRTKFEGRPVDFWNLAEKQGTVRFAGFDAVYNGPLFTGFVVRHEHVDLSAPGGEKIALNETWDVRLWALGEPGDKNAAWIWDLTSIQTCASDSPLELDEYRYGGLGFRGAKEWKDDNYLARASNGKTHLDGHTTRAKWCDHAGKVEGEYCGVLILAHPENFRFPEPMRLWEKGGAFFNWAPVQADPFKIEPGKPHVSRYRFVVRDGDLTIEQCESLWRQFAEPIEVKVSAP